MQWLKRLRPALFREDLLTLFGLLRQHKIQPLVARLPFVDARRAHELLGGGGVTGKLVLVPAEKSAVPAEHPAAYSA
ncbi:MAG TPA: zinc-binding dehydrogenase [Vicinamibacterales bacterium]|nr:zinc-binding dehydrogenase [Vicinamibacterales bacterium]